MACRNLIFRTVPQALATTTAVRAKGEEMRWPRAPGVLNGQSQVRAIRKVVTMIAIQ